MKILKLIPYFLIISMLFVPMVSTVRAEAKPDYVGIDVGDVIIWRVFIDDDPYEDYLEDAGVPESIRDNITDAIFDDAWDKDVIGWKVVILEIKDEKEMDYKGDDVDYVPYLFNYYITEDLGARDWEEEDTNEKGTIGNYAGDGKDVYVDRVSVMTGLLYWIAGNNINWNQLANEVDEEWEDDWDDDNEKASASVESSLYKDNGISTTFNPDEDDFEDFDSIAQFNDDGVLMYYEWNYDDDPIIILELEGRFFQENFLIILGGAVAGVVVVILVVTLVITLKKKKGKKEKIIPTPSEKTPEVIPSPPTTVSSQLNFCPNCGSKISTDASFCTECGSNLKD